MRVLRKQVGKAAMAKLLISSRVHNFGHAVGVEQKRIAF